MLPKNKLRERRLERLRIFPANEMGILEANLLRSWEDGTLPSDWNPTKLVAEKPRILLGGLVDKSAFYTTP